MSDIVIEGRVAQILNARELVLNKGAENGVKEGMIFAVMSQNAMEIKDPETGQLLDVIDREKVRVKVSEIRDKITICRTFKTKKIGSTVSSVGSALTAMEFFRNQLVHQEPKEIPETLKAEDSQLPPPLTPEQSYVKINDRMIQVKE